MWIFDFYFGKEDSPEKRTYMDNLGYFRFCDCNTLVHKWVAENKLGRKLKQQEIAAHKDRNKSNNSADNILVFENRKERDQFYKKNKKPWKFLATV